MNLQVVLYLFLIIFSQSLMAEEIVESISCSTKTNNHIETCHAASLEVESSCELKITDTTNQKALDLINKHLADSATESAFGVLIVQGSKHKDLLEKYKDQAELCQKDLSKYQGSCKNLEANIQSCEDSEANLSDDSLSLNKNLFHISENKFSIAQENQSEISKKIELLELEIKKTTRDLCKQGFDSETKLRDCENLSPELSKKINNAFASCARENASYNESECFNTVKPSLKGDFMRPAVQASSFAKNETQIAPTSISEKSPSSELATNPANTQTQEKVERYLANESVTPKALSASPKINERSFDQADYNEVALLKKSPNEDSYTKARSSSEFKWPSLGTILKVATGALLVYGAVTGKLKKWFNKFAEAINPLSNSNARSPSSSGDSGAAGGSGCYGTYRGTIDMPPHEERIIARNIKIRSIGKQVTGNPAIDNAATGGGAPDGGMFLTGSFHWETDANCRVVSGTAYIFGHPFSITGAINKDRTFNLSYLGPMPGHITSNNLVKGKLQHGGGEEYIYGYLNGHFTPKK